MRILYLDCFCGFDLSMLLGALVNMGVETKEIENEIKKICPEVKIKKNYVKRCAIEALRVDIITENGAEYVKCEDIPDFTNDAASGTICATQLVRTAKLYADAVISSSEVKECVSKSQLMNEICVSCAVMLAMERLNTEYVICSHLKEGSGIDIESEPPVIVPTPATMEILKRSKIPYDSFNIQSELIMPWSAAFLCTVVNEYGTMPKMDIIKIGYGAGAKDYTVPNLIRTVIGEQRNMDFEQMFASDSITAEFADEFAAIVK